MTLQELAGLYHLLYEQQLEIIELREAAELLRGQIRQLEQPVPPGNGVSV